MSLPQSHASQRSSASLIVSSASRWFTNQPVYRQVLLVLGAVVAASVGGLALVFHKVVLEYMVEVSAAWAKMPLGRVLYFGLVFFVGFPPLVGFSTLSLLAGTIYGFPYGWPLLAVASITGSLASFIVFRYFFLARATAFVHTNRTFGALSEVMREGNPLMLLVLVRLCPLPYSLSNGALAAIPDVTATRFFLSSALSSPKMLIHVFVGAKLKHIGETKSLTSRWLDVLSITITLVATACTTYVIYVKMKAKLEAAEASAEFVLYDGDERSFDPELQTLNSSGGGVSQFDFESAAFDDDPMSIGEEFIVGDGDSVEELIPKDDEVVLDDLGLDPQRSHEGGGGQESPP